MSEEFNQEFVFVWRIQNLSHSYHKSGEGIDSPVFILEGLKKSKWFLRVFPRGEIVENKEFISIFLHNKNPEEYELDCEIRIIGADGNEVRTRKFGKDVFSPNGSWGYKEFVKAQDVYDKIKDGLDVLTFRCRLFFNSQQTDSECEARTEIGIDQQSIVWNVRIPDISSRILKKEIQFPKDSVFEITLHMPEDVIKIDIRSKKELPNSKSVTCKMSLLNSKGKHLISKSSNHIFDEKNLKWKFPNFITKKFLDDNKSAFVESDTVCLLCKYVSSNGTITNNMLGMNKDIDACSTLQMKYTSMFLDKTYSDVELKAENQVLKAHKCVLAVSSPVFFAMFQRDMLESKTNTVHIPDVEADTLKSFLKYLYTETIEDLDFDTAKKLLLVAEKYQVFNLKEKCVSFMESVVSLGNVFEILSLSDLIGHERLKHAAINIIISNSEIVLNLPEWSDLIQNNTKLATEMIAKIVSTKGNLK